MQTIILIFIKNSPWKNKFFQTNYSLICKKMNLLNFHSIWVKKILLYLQLRIIYCLSLFFTESAFLNNKFNRKKPMHNQTSRLLTNWLLRFFPDSPCGKILLIVTSDERVYETWKIALFSAMLQWSLLACAAAKMNNTAYRMTLIVNFLPPQFINFARDL